MIKAIVCIALLCAVLVAVHGNPNGQRGGSSGERGGPNGGHGGPNGGGGQWASELCANDSLPPQFLAQTTQLISNLESNGSYAQVLSDRAQEIQYLKNSDNTALLSSNCTGYFSGLKSAKEADRQVLETQRQYQKTADYLFGQIVRTLLGKSGY